jgi:hypothetical protein
MRNLPNESFIRWQNIRITQLGFANNLIITLSVASLGYLMNFINIPNILNFFQKLLFWISSTLLIFSCFFGLLLVVNRLEDFKITAQIAKKRETEENINISILREKTEKLGKKTWNLFITQVSTFFVGFLFLTIIISISIFNKIN